MKIAILGAGMIVQDWLPIAKELENIELAAMLGTDKDKEAMEKAQATYGIGQLFYDYDELLASDVADTMYVALPNFLHYSFSKKALEAGKNVIVEKPFASNLKEFTELEQLALDKNLFLMEAITNQYLKNYDQVKLDLAKVGDVKIVECNYSQYSSRYDLFKQGTILPAFNPAMSGGALMDLNIYNIHFVAGLFGKPQSVQYLANMERGIDTSGMLVMDYGNFKCVSIGAKDCAAPVVSTIQGNKGSIRVEGPTNELRNYFVQKNGEEAVKVDLKDHEHRMFDEFFAFEQMVANNDLEGMKTRLAHSRIAMEIVEEAKASAGLVFGADK
jgi:predicted dehydrogenase